METWARHSNRPIPRTFVLRTYRRIPTWCASYYLSGAAIGKGVVTNLSRSGMRMLGDHALKAGTDLCVRFQLEEDQPPIEITRATVRWVREYEFGLRIDDQTAAAAGRIAEVLNRQARTGLNGW
ncbi:MAG: PilZ domain-containing protein [Nitrospira sp.]|nr:PilZ domain-containing protein [Nitrospira sp.]